uniref:Secreted protein n=1 Tax=Picea glauca TaxID=3330 RepID=A0A101LXK3_PICGL|nr:hypothetical protein ABT39_MTgene6210 [Picea glauca]
MVLVQIILAGLECSLLNSQPPIVSHIRAPVKVLIRSGRFAGSLLKTKCPRELLRRCRDRSASHQRLSPIRSLPWIR